MKSLLRPRIWIALSLGLAAALVAYHWPSSPRATIACEHACWHFAFSRDSTKLALLDCEPGLNPPTQILLLDTATGHALWRIEIHQDIFPSRISFAPDDKTIGVLDAGVVTKWDPSTGRLIARYDHAEWSHDPDRYDGCEILFSPAGRWLLHDVHAGRVYDVETGDVVQDYRERWPNRNLNVHGGCVAALVEDEVKTFDVLTGAELGRFATARPRVPMARTALTFSGDGTHGIYFGDAGQWVVHNAIEGRECRLGIRSGADVHDCCLSADHRYAAVSSGVGDHNGLAELFRRLFNTAWSVRVFDTASGAEVGQPIRYGFTSGFAPDGTTLAVAGMDKLLTLWDWPPPGCWPLTLTVALATVLLSYGVCFWWSWRRGGARGGSPSFAQCPEGAQHDSPGQRPGLQTPSDAKP